MKNIRMIFLCGIVFSTCLFKTFAQQITTLPVRKIASLKLVTSENKPYALTFKKLSVLVFLSPECPLSKNYVPVLNTLFEKYPQLDFYGIFPGKAYSVTEIITFKKDYGIKFILLKDPAKLLTGYTGATTTPQAILVSSSGQILYNGLIDNWAVSLGKTRKVITEHYLNDAISQSLNNKKIAITNTRPVGCRINDI